MACGFSAVRSGTKRWHGAVDNRNSLASSRRCRSVCARPRHAAIGIPLPRQTKRSAPVGGVAAGDFPGEDREPPAAHRGRSYREAFCSCALSWRPSCRSRPFCALRAGQNGSSSALSHAYPSPSERPCRCRRFWSLPIGPPSP
jgi:hypothetical protein